MQPVGWFQFFFCFFFNDTATTEIYTLSLHDALPISGRAPSALAGASRSCRTGRRRARGDRKSTRLNSSHSQISDAVFCLKKKKNGLRGTARYELVTAERAGQVAPPAHPLTTPLDRVPKHADDLARPLRLSFFF